MDPVSVLGVAAAAVQFATFSGSIVKNVINIYRSVISQDSIEDYRSLEEQAKTLRSSNLRLKQTLDMKYLKRERNESENDLLSVADQAIDVASNILKALDKFDLKGERSKLEKIRKAIKAVLEKEELEALNQRLAQVQQQQMSVVLLGLQ